MCVHIQSLLFELSCLNPIDLPTTTLHTVSTACFPLNRASHPSRSSMLQPFHPVHSRPFETQKKPWYVQSIRPTDMQYSDSSQEKKERLTQNTMKRQLVAPYIHP